MFFLFFSNTILPAQDYKFEHLTLEDGLVDNGVFSLHLDQKGFLWAGTCNGLMKYDGRSFEIIQSDITGNFDLAQGCIYNITENKDGNLWLATYNGLYFFDVWKNELKYYPHLKEKAVGIENTIWFAAEDQSHHVWMVDNMEQLVMLDLETNRITFFSGDPVAYPFFENNKVAMMKVGLSYKPAFYQDRDGNIWIGTTEKGLLKYDQKTGAFLHFEYSSNNPKGINSNRILNIFSDKDQHIWVGTANGINRFDPDKNSFTFIGGDYPAVGNSKEDSAWVNLQDKQGNLWIAGKGDMWKLNPVSGQVVHFPFSGKNNYIVPVHEGADGSFWVFEWSTHNNKAVLYELDRTTKKYTAYISEKENKEGVFSGIGFTQYLADNSGVFWLGSFREGINKLDPLGRKFHPYKPKKKAVQVFRSPKGLPNIQIMEDEKGILWQVNDGKLTWIRQHVKDRKGDIWMLNNHRPFDTNGKGVTRLETATHTYTDFFDESDRENTACGSTGSALILDRSGNIWIAFWDYFTEAPAGLVKYDPFTSEFTCYQPNPSNPNSLVHEAIADLHEDKNGNIWIALIGVVGETVLQKLDPRTGLFTNYQGFKSTIWEIEEDATGMLWLGTILQGLVKFDPVSGTIIKQYRQGDGLANSSVQDIEIDKENNLWLRTEFGLSKFYPKTETFENFTVEDGLLTNRANGTQLAFQTADGNIFLATPTQTSESDLIFFSPNAVKDNPYPPKLAFTNFKLFNKNLGIGGDSPLKQHISRTDKIRLAYEQNDFTIAFAALHFNRPNENEYAYKLEPIDKGWRNIGTQNNVTLRGLDPGNYVFSVKAANYDGVWNEEGISLKIKVLSPWYRTWWAFLLYALAFGTLLFFLRRYQINRLLERANNERIKELDALKTKLYTNITHEFRTPLTVIMGMADQLDEEAGQPAANLPEKVKERCRFILRNAGNLLRLVNQMLDLSKLDSGKLNIKWEHGDVVIFLQYLSESFLSFAETKNIKLTFYPEIKYLEMDYDREKMQHIVSNLLTNAIKYTPKGGKIVFHVSTLKPNGVSVEALIPEGVEEFLQIKVSDSGVGIPARHLPHIFDRFYQVDDSKAAQAGGTGIGLTLTKELVELMGGNISVTSDEGRGSQFTVQLPIEKRPASQPAGAENLKPALQYFDPAVPAELMGGETKFVDDADHPLLLIIEDNPDVATYIRTCLENQYTVLWSENGQLGIEKAIEAVPDIIISDVMMPEKDGYEVTQFLKNDERTSHIPIILLTAKADTESRITGLERGADAYLAKPFDKKELLVRVEKLIELRRILQARYNGNEAFSFSPSMEVEKTGLPEDKTIEIESAFLKKINAVLEQHLSDAEFEVPDLCKAVQLSQSQLYRKIKALTDRSTSSYIRVYRLHKGRELLQTTDLNISEVAYQVGFTDPAYFSRTFSEEFGVAPNELRK
ncbi:MAG: response regulator [Lewinellaceae bacterium]|nr:response regulator [Lewinellaceae bacterium]